VVSLICGALWDVTATARAAFLPIIIATLVADRAGADN
jgi:hypothetical protein